MNVELFFDINGDKKKVELSESIDYSLNKQFIDLNDLTSYTTDYSKTINIPMTPHNNELFNYVFKLQSIQDNSYFTYNVNEKIQCYLMWNNNILLEGWFRLESADYKEKTYSGTLISKLQPIFKDLLNTDLEKFEQIISSNGSTRSLMENIQVNPRTILDSINRDFTDSYNENDVNHYYDIIGFAPQQVVKSSSFDTTKIQYNPASRTLPETWRNPQTPGVNIVDYVKWFQETLRGVENPDTQYHEALIQENMSFPQKLEMRCTMYRTYFYVKSLLKMIKHKLRVENQIELDYDDIEDIIPTNLCYFPKSIYNDKKFGDSESNETDISVAFLNNQSTIYPLASQVNGLFNNNHKYSSCNLVEDTSNSAVSITQSDDKRFLIVKNKLDQEQSLFCQLSGDVNYGCSVINIANNLRIKKIEISKELNYPFIIPIYKNANTNDEQIIKFLVYYPSKRKKQSYKLLVRSYLDYLKQYMPSHPDYEEFIDNNDHKKEDVWEIEKTITPNYFESIGSGSFNINQSFFKVTLASYEECTISFGEKLFFVPNIDEVEQDENVVLFDGNYKYSFNYSSFQKRDITQNFVGGYNNIGEFVNANNTYVTFNEYVYFDPTIVTIKFNYKTDYEHNWNNLNDLFGNDFKPYKWFFDFCKKYRFYIEYDQFNSKLTVFSKYFTNEHGLNIVNKQIDYNKSVKVEPVNNKYSYVQYGYSDKNVPDKTKTDGDAQYGDINYETGYKEGSVLKLVNYDEICPVFTDPIVIPFNSILEWEPNTSVNNIPVRNQVLGISLLYDISDGKFADNEFYAIRGDRKTLIDSNGIDINYWITSTNDIEVVNNCTCYHATLQFISYPVGPDVSTKYFRNFNYSGTNPNGDNVSIFFNTPSFVLNNEAVENSISIYKYRWENYLDEIFDINNKKVTCYVPLSVAEYYNFRFNQLWNIEGNLFIVNKIIDYNPTNNEPTKVELIQVNNIENYN